MSAPDPDPKDTLVNPESGQVVQVAAVETTVVITSRPPTGVPAGASDNAGSNTLESAGQASRPPEASQASVAHQVGRFAIEQLLGRGGQGKVWLANDPLLGRRVAIKQLPKGTELTEARLAAAIEHPNVCRVYDFLSTDEHDFIVMEYVGGETLLRAKRRGFKLEEGLRVLLQVARGLAAAHERGVIHRDLKADNVLLTPFGVAKITDFGISRRDSEPLSSEPSLSGTPHSMSPEQSLGQATDARSDLFSFGVLCYELLTGESPFLGRDLHDTLHRVRALTPPALHELEPNVPRSLSQLVQRLLAKSPADRDTNAEKLAHALEAIIDQSDRTSAPSTGRGERRQVVLLACELTLAPGNDDPELLLQFRQDYRRAVERSVDELGGSVHLAVGQQYVLCFGYPQPHEDSARRAARAALGIADFAEAVGQSSSIGVRAALHAGTGVILERGQESELELGNLLRTVQGLRDLSSEAGVVVSDAACELLHGSVELGEPRSVALAGNEQVYRPLVRLTLPRRARHALPLIGREEERLLLRRACQRAAQGNGKLLLLQGEPGIGKSRLLAAVREELGDTLRWAAVRATPDTSHTPFAPIADLLSELLGMTGVPGDERLSRAEGQLERYGIAPGDVLPYFDSLLRLPATSDRLRSPAWESPERRREATLVKIINLLQRLAEQTPLVVVLEDAHWADASTLELFERLAPRLNNLRLLLLISARTEFSRPGMSGPNVSVLQLGALSPEESQELVTRASGAAGLTPALLQGIIERADGVPLFLEHVARSLRLAAADGVSNKGYIPSSLRDLFAAQLHRAGADRSPLEVAAVIGREFELGLWCRAARVTPQEGEKLLARLAQQGLVEISGGLREQETWQFRHALIRDAAYESMLKPRRQMLHAEVLEALSGSAQASLGERPELLARHAEGAGALERALELWLRAAGHSAARYALREADEAYAECLRLLRALPESEERDARELELLAGRGAIQQALYGYAAEPVVTTYARADQLCQSLDAVPFPVIRGVWNVHVVKGDKPATLRYAERIAALLAAERLNRLDRGMAHNCLGTFHWFTGEFQRCLHHYEAAAYRSQDHVAMVATYGGCGGAYARILSPYARAVLGSPGRARRESAEVVAVMAELDDPFSHAMALLYDLMLDRELGDLERAFSGAQLLLERCQRHGFAQLLPLAAITVAAAKVHRDADLESLTVIVDSLTLLGAVGARTPAAYWLAWLAEALLRVDSAQGALGAVEQALAASASGLDHFYDCELHRLKAAALAALGKPAAEIEAAFAQSLELARERGHGLFELKTALDLAEFSVRHGNPVRARELLQLALPKLEASDAPVLARAQTLLAQL